MFIRVFVKVSGYLFGYQGVQGIRVFSGCRAVCQGIRVLIKVSEYLSGYRGVYQYF